MQVSTSAITLIDKNRMFIGMHVHIDTCACTLHDTNFDSVLFVQDYLLMAF